MELHRAAPAEALKALRLKMSYAALSFLILFICSGLIQGLTPEGPMIEGAQVAQLDVGDEVLASRAGSGLIFGILGGFRTLAADITWLRMNEAWEDKNLAETEALIRLTVLIDPRPEVFWRTGGHTLAFDMPVWRIRSRGDEFGMPESIQRKIREEQLERGVKFLLEGARIHPENPNFPIWIGQFYLNAFQDYEKTIQYFRQAWKMKGAPYHIGRLLARVLERAGRPREALEILYADLEKLPAGDPEAFVPFVKERIAELENSLGR